ncbi:hypothetical protein PSENEW3_00004045 [Picochlorum sp. SENEW3]|nr:hypothetical protein PSENEW3_00004045 [Picochlorum sp. SENEW3]
MNTELDSGDSVEEALARLQTAEELQHYVCVKGNGSRTCDVIDVAIRILKESDGDVKCNMTSVCLDLYEQGFLKTPCGGRSRRVPPETPGKDARLEFVGAHQMPNRGKGGSLASRQAILHSLVHIEGCAVDLALDIMARFGEENATVLTDAFYHDFLVVASDEARHYQELKKRLRDTGMEYGDLPVHEGLWESAMETKHSLPARLAVESCVHEARGLDILPQTIARFRKGGDEESAALLEKVVYPEEITHCAVGVSWLKRLFDAARQGNCSDVPWVKEALEFDSVECWFHWLVRNHFRGNLKPPFNEQARSKAGFSKEWYMPLATKSG